MYRTIDAKFWHDPKVKKLSTDGKLLLLYLVTNPHSHLCGLYYLPKAIMQHETGLKNTVLDTLCHTLSTLGIAYFDDEYEAVFLTNMLNYQGRGEKNEASATKQLETFAGSKLTAMFLAKYNHFSDRVSHRVLDRVSEFGTPEQEQEQNQSKEQNQNQEQGDSLEPPAASKQKVVLVYDVVGGHGDKWNLLDNHVKAMESAFPRLDIMEQCRKAQHWVTANPAKRKTPKGMLRFLHGWMERAQNSGKGKGKPEDSGSRYLVIEPEEFKRLKDLQAFLVKPYREVTKDGRVRWSGQKRDGTRVECFIEGATT